MYKQEAIKRVEELYGYGSIAKTVTDIISQIHEPQRVVVPKFVAEWIEEHKAQFSNLYTVYSWLGQQKNQVSEWVNSNIDIFARAYGWTVTRLSRRSCTRWRYLTQIAQILSHSCIRKMERYLLEVISFG